MRIPAVALAVAFACGILLGRQIPTTELSSFKHALGFLFATTAISLLGAILLVSHSKLWPAAIASLLCWASLGAAAVVSASRPLPPEHVLSRITAGQLDLTTPLRWYGSLQEEPARLPWGYGLDVNLSGVETANGMIPVTGGMRLGFTPGMAIFYQSFMQETKLVSSLRPADRRFFAMKAHLTAALIWRNRIFTWWPR